ncbi:hypothetical protein KAU15_02610, partial [candidate division WOR-3 bacterium]|nr:hypothetical protein [candidate division WOR-3 bacterium]
SNYFALSPSYPPAGVYMYVLTGKLSSFINTLSVNNIPLLFIYKLFPLLSLIILFNILIKNLKFGYNIKILALLFIPIALITTMTGQSDVIILLFLFCGISQLNKNEFYTGTFLLIFAVFVKQTAFFLSFAILIFYFMKSHYNKKLLLYGILNLILISLIMYAPFIIKGEFINAIKYLWDATIESSPLSGYALNMYSIIPNANMIDFNMKIGFLSLKSISIGMIGFVTIVISYIMRKKQIWEYMIIISIIWFNIMVGLRSQHIIYLLFFVIIFTLYNRKIIVESIVLTIITVLNVLLYNSMITMKLFGIPVPHISVTIILSIIQFIASIFLISKLMNGKKNKKIRNIFYHKRSFSMPYIMLIIFVLLTVLLPGKIKEEKSFISETILNNKLLNYSKDRYIELSVISRGPFRNYLGIRMADEAEFSIDAMDYSKINFRVSSEYCDNGKLIINGNVYTVGIKEKNYRIEKDSNFINFLSNIESGYKQIAIYDIKYE